MEVVEEEKSVTESPSGPCELEKKNANAGLDSDDDETLRFEQDDDLYSSDLDEVDARWVKKQVIAFRGQD